MVGTSGNDTINGAVGSTTTFQTPDVIDGGAGTDTLNVTFDGASPAFPAATISNVEVFKIRDAGNTAGLTVDFATIAGETEVYSDRSTNAGGATTFDNLATGTTVGIIGQNGAITGNALNFTYATGTDAVNLVVADGVKQAAGTAAISSTSAATTATITSKGAANTVGQVTLTGAKLTSVTVDAQSNFKADAGAGAAAILGFDSTSTAATLTIKGAGKADVGFLDANLDVVNAADNTGGITAIISAAGQQITGGAGNDTITTLAAGTLMTKVVDAGAGTGDKLIINGANTVDSTTKGAQFKNFEVLQANAAAIQDVANLSANNTFTSAVINQSTTAATGITNMNATMAGAVTVLAASGAGAITFGIKDASVAGNIDTLKLTLDDGQAATVAPATFTLTAPVMTGIEKLEIVNNETTTISTLASATALNDVKVSGSGAFTVTTTGAVNFAANTKFDFSGVTGAVSFNAAAAQAGTTATGLSITGSATAANTLTDSIKSDMIVGGAKGDTLAFQGGSDVITLGGGADVTTFAATAKGTDVLGAAGVTFKFADGDSVAVAGSGTGLGIGFDATKTDTITNFDVTTLAATAGSKFTLDTAQAGGAFTVVTSAVKLGTTTVTNANDFLVVNDTANSAAYVYQDTNGNKTIDAGDFAIKLVGSAALDAGEFSLSTGGDLVFTAA